jgi:hypothetical protein
LVSLAVGILAGSIRLAPATPPETQPLSQLQQEFRRLARQRCDDLMAMQRADLSVSPAEILFAARCLVDAERQSRAAWSERARAIRNYVEQLQTTQKLLPLMPRRRVVGAVDADLHEVRYRLLEAETWQLKESDPRQQDLAKAQVDLANQVMAGLNAEPINSVAVELLCQWSRRLMEARRGDLAQADAALEIHLQCLRQLGDQVDSHLRTNSRALAPTDAAVVRYYQLEAEIIQARAKGQQVPAPVVAAFNEAGRRVYDAAHANLRNHRGRINLERICTWSRRWMDANLEISDQQGNRTAARKAHLDRMRTSEELAAWALNRGSRSTTKSMVDGLHVACVEARCLVMQGLVR